MSKHQGIWNKVKVGYVWAAGLFGVTFGLTYLFPLFYRTFCEKYGWAGQNPQKKELVKITDDKLIHRKFIINFKGISEEELGWSFFPLQESVVVHPGETVLAFYRAHNSADNPRIGVSAYIVQPDEAVPYFHKIQCFCFDEQMLNPQEEVDLPLFFYLDPEIAKDPKFREQKELNLMYSFYFAEDQTLANLLAEHPMSPLNMPASPENILAKFS